MTRLTGLEVVLSGDHLCEVLANVVQFGLWCECTCTLSIGSVMTRMYIHQHTHCDAHTKHYNASRLDTCLA